MRRIFTSLTLSILFCIIFSASNYSIAATNDKHTFKEGTYKPGILIIKVKPEFRTLCTDNSVSDQRLKDGLNEISASSINKKFPRHKAPEAVINKYGERLVDLSLIYQIEFSPVIKIEEAISIIKLTGIAEYVEPLFIRTINFTPNDPSIGSQYALGKISAYTAWDVWTGDTNVVIGIVDTGTDWDHPDLQANIKYNYADPIDGLDNDSDGFTDNFRGWDVSENDNNPMVGAQVHGSHVSGCADAVTNNSTGVAGPAYNCKFLPVKSSLDASGNSIDNPMEGVIYAADHGANVINCSFGGGNFSQMEQDAVNYATINQDALIVASAGNTGTEESDFPASYENVISVASTGSSDVKSGFSTYGPAVDVCAPGSNIFSTVWDDDYTNMSGTSMASPIAAGCAAMIKSRFPSFNARQVGEQLRSTCDNINASNTAYIGKIGKGRVNLYRAVTDSLSPGVIVKTNNINDGNDNVFIVGDTLDIVTLYENLLRPTTNLTCTLSTTNSFVQVLQNGFAAGVVGTLDTVSNFTSAYRVYIKPTAPVNTTVQFRMTLNDGTWNDIFVFNVTVNVDYINITVNNISTSITSKSLIGYNQGGQLEGLGFRYKGSASILYDMGMMVGVQSLQVSDNVRGATAGADDADFAPFNAVSAQNPGVISDFDVNGSFKDNGSTSNIPLNILVSHHAYAWAAAPDDNYVMILYNIKNIGTSTLNNLHAGIFSDWDVPLYGNNKCSTDLARRMGYIWSTDVDGLWGGIKLLSHTGGFNHYAIDNIDNATGILMTDGFNDAEKFTSLSTTRADAGTGSATGNDVISVVSSGGFNLAPGDSVEVAFALVAGEDLVSIQIAAEAAQAKYDFTFVGIEPISNANKNELFQSYPNPASKDLRIDFSLVEAGNSQLCIYNMIGEKVKTIVDQKLSAGKYSILVDVNELPAGNYFYRLTSGNFTKTLPLSVVR